MENGAVALSTMFPSPEKSASRKLAFAGFPHSENAVLSGDIWRGLT
jgi:hypothetical protein